MEYPYTIVRESFGAVVGTWQVSPHIWFVVTVRDGEIQWVEEHDMRAGGGVTKGANQTYEDLFFEVVEGRWKGHRDEARVFLDTLLNAKPEEVKITYAKVAGEAMRLIEDVMSNGESAAAQRRLEQLRKDIQVLQTRGYV